MRSKTCLTCGKPFQDNSDEASCAECLAKRFDPTRPSPLRFACPHCHHRVELVDEIPLGSIHCPSCDSDFFLIEVTSTLGDTDQPTRTVNHFELLECVGQGAFGSVWKARDTELDRIVAIKLPRQQMQSKEEIESFFREARAAAQLHHPGIVSVHEVGRCDEQVYIVSDFIDGLTLADYLTGHHPDSTQAANWGILIAEALQHAHDCGVIHRDLKPSNILVRRENQREGGDAQTLHLTDFGLAKRDSGEMTVTIDGRILGTPAYMSPEQARGEGHSVDGRTDVYSLGVILFELLTGEKPFRGNSRMLIDQVIHDEPPSPRKLNNAIPRDLDTICMKAMEKTPSRRYATARDLANDLHRFIEHRPITARPVSRPEHALRWCRRNPGLASLTTAFLVTLLGGLAATAWQWRRSESHRQRAQQQSMESSTRLVRMKTINGNQALAENRTLEAMDWYGEALEESVRAQANGTGESSIVANEQSLRKRLGILRSQLPVLLHCFTHDHAIENAIYDPTGTRIVTLTSDSFRIWNAEDGTAITPIIRLFSNSSRACFSPSGRVLTVLTLSERNRELKKSNGHVHFYDAQTGEAIRPAIALADLNLFHASFSADERWIAVAAGNQAHVIDILSGDPVIAPIQHTTPVVQVEISPDNTRFLSTSEYIEAAASTKLVELPSGKSVLDLDTVLTNSDAGHEEFYPEDSRLNSLPKVFSTDGRLFATFRSDPSGGRSSGPQVASLRSALTGEVLLDNLKAPNWIRAVAFSSDNQIAWVRSGSSLKAYRTIDGEPVVAPWPDSLNDYRAMPDGVRLMSLSSDGPQTILSMHHEYSDTLLKVPGRPQSLEVRPDGAGAAMVVSGPERERGRLHLYDVAHEQTTTFDAWQTTIPVCFSSDASRLLEVRHGIARQWDLAINAPRRIPIADSTGYHVELIERAASGKYIAVALEKSFDSAFGSLLRVVELPEQPPFDRLFHGETFDLPQSFPIRLDKQFTKQIREIRFASRDESKVAIRFNDDSLSCFQLEREEAIWESPTAVVEVDTVGFEGADTLIVVAGPASENGRSEGETRRGVTIEHHPLHAAATRSIRQLPPHTLSVLSADGSLLMLATKQGEVSIQIARTGVEVQSIRELDQEVSDAAFSPDGKSLLMIFDNSMLGIWNLATGQRVAPLIGEVHQACFGPDSKTLITIHRDELTRLWDAETSDPLGAGINSSRVTHRAQLAFLPALTSNTNTLISASATDLWCWDLRADDRSTEAIKRDLAARSGFMTDDVGGYLPIGIKRFEKLLEPPTASQPAFTLVTIPPKERAHRKDRWHDDIASLLPPGFEATFDWWFKMPDGHLYPSPSQFHLTRVQSISPKLFARRGLSHFASGSLQAAVSDFDRAIEHEPDDVRLRLCRGIALDALGNEDAAARDVALAFEQGGEMKASDFKNHRLPAAAATGLSRRMEAQSVVNDPALSRRLLKLRAALYKESHQWQKAADDFTTLIGLGINSRTDRADCWLALQQWHSAIDDLTAAINSGQAYPPWVLDRAGAHAMLGQFDLASQEFDERLKQAVYDPSQQLWSLTLIEMLNPNADPTRRVRLQEAVNQHAESLLNESTPRRQSTFHDWAIPTVLAAACVSTPAELHTNAVPLARRYANDRPFDPHAVFALALALFRSEEIGPAVEQLNLIEPPTDSLRITVPLLRALIEQHRADMVAAESFFQAAETAAQSWPYQETWQSLALQKLLRREALLPDQVNHADQGVSVLDVP